ncbi:alpha-2-macroglobulin family protein [Flavobacterium xueshanense]|uniref:TonB-dependent outer membrane receptor, SusC/RagA subfamily, signature region n=1 Tax=Flavobacterium xueshanense TaxID=935223 RepID=A0A1I2CV61_9FLAO|nr:alpha-2-macroglobulin family protein [Flavobacterium xueshanense]SFE72201.1 TonB-dependent outer membrane receptor, SusC/RagA subfamily, signature region [Flavobacterium xueshanense]
MKNIFLLFLFISTSIFGQDYDKNWLKVIEYENDVKIKSANEIVSKIQQKASRDKNEVQIIKCFFYESKYLQVLDENAQTKIINNLKTEINKASVPTKAILNLVYAKCLIDYQKHNSYLLYNRTNTISFDNQFLTWTSKDFLEQINRALEKTLLDEAILKQTSLSNYLLIFDYSDEEKTKKDNLFNYLLKENIALLTPQIQQWEIQKKEFLPYEKELLGNSASFLKLNFAFVKNEKLKKVLELYQKQEKDAPVLENQFDRIQFCNSYILESVDTFMKSLNAIQKESKDLILTQNIQLEKAIILNRYASKEIHPDYNIQAVATLDSIININNRINAHKLALQKKQNISSKSLNIQLQKFIYSDEITRAFVQYKNTNRISISFFKIDQNNIKDFRNSPYNKDSLVSAIIKNKIAIATKYYEVEEKNNYFEYSTEVLLPPLKTGSYLVYFESDAVIKNSKAFAYETITVSNITVLTSENDKKENYQVLDRKTGKPIENVSITLLNQTILTDKNGKATYLKENNNRNYNLIEFTTENDSLLLNNRYSNYYNDYATIENQKAKGKVEFYLDRAIYRPGQTVYYKGIAFRKGQDKTSVVAKTSFKITIQDPNGTVFKEFDVVTNEYGSFFGEFLLPKSGLTGNFRMTADEPDNNKNFIFVKTNDQHQFWDDIEFNDSEISFRVEEYKRPKFEVTFEPFKNAYQVNQKVSVNGLAKAFSGSNISDAKVAYKVTLIPYTLNNGYYYHQNGKSEIILVGETKTDATGKFEINFIAKPFENASKEQLPIFEYYITASVTDSNGETHQAQTNVRIGYHSLTLTATIPKRIETKNKNEIELNSTNLNGEFLAVKVEIKLYYVSPFSNKFKSRVFPKPEIETISKEDFQRSFPYEDNKKPNDLKLTEILVFSKKIDTEKDKKIALDFISKYKSGNYKVVFSAKDAFENPIETISNFQLIQSKDKIDSSKLFVAEQINTDAKKDGFVLVKLKSVIPELYINTTGNYQSSLYFENTFHLQNNETIVKIPLKKEFEKSMKIGFESIFENQTFYDQIEVILKEEESKLKFTVESFRNKIQPGSSENWSFQLKTFNTSKEAEVLASMYDSSLDQFAKRDWNGLKFNDYNYNSANFKTGLGFDKTSSYIRNLNPIFNRIELIDETTKLMWFGFNFNDSFTKQQLKEYQKQLNTKSKKPLNAKMISGIVTDGKYPLPGARVTIEGIERGTQTDFDGYYQIEAAVGEELTFSYIGFETKKIAIVSNRIDVQLEESDNNLEEVVVVGYSSVKKKSLTAATPEVVEEADNQIYNTAGIDMKLEGKASGITIRGNSSISGNYKNALYIVDGEPITEEQFKLISPSDIISVDILKAEKATALYGSKGANGVIIITTKKALEALTQVKARKNLSETAFFYPNLKTDAKGKVSFNFTSPEALTAWKLRLLAHNKEAGSGYLEKSVITQKELMVTPNFPRFFREKDSIVITAKVANITSTAKTGIAVLQLFDATTMQSIDAKMRNANTVRNFKIAPFGNTTVSWKIYIPEGLQGVQYKVLAKAGNFSDGEENILPVLTNNMLVTESIPIWVRENSKKEYTFENLKNNTSSTLRNHQITLEYTSNPSWIAIQSLPYLMEFEHECAEQTFARFYANALASEIISSNPKIANLFETWRKNGKLNSELEENEELKSIILAETPWLNDAKSEDEKKKNVALLFDLEKMKISQEATFKKLKQKQNDSGGFAWFEGSTENEYITRHILAGLGHLSKLSTTENNAVKIKQITATGIPFLDQKFLENHKTTTEKLNATEKFIWSNPYTDLHYLYTRSFYLKTYPLSDTLKKVTKLYLETAKKEWLTYSLYEKGLAALTLNRFGEKETAKKILVNLKETASNNKDWGMYWIANKSGWYWYQAPIETQALLIEAFAEITNDNESVNAMKVWLLKNKQTKNWPTTKSTTEAIYALLMQGTDWLSVKDNTIIKIGNEKILTRKLSENEKEAETGYVKLNWKADEIKKDMATISIDNKSKVPGFGGVYWQFFEDLDKIKTNSTAALSVTKELYVKKNTDKGEILQRITSNNSLQLGDLVTVRLVISAKEDMEFVHLKDMRASCFEPVDVLSAYQYKGGLGFYKSTKDAATHFFFDQINKGTYVLEYDLRVNNSGDFSNGITTIQSMYAPEFTSHTEGIRFMVKQ